MTDKELLELAAKAAGIEYDLDDLKNHKKGRAFFGLWLVCHGEPYEGQRRYWNPLEDDGDALRLAVKCDIRIGPTGCNGMPSVAASDMPWIDESEGDPYAATRRAIVRAAAEIGKTIDNQKPESINGKQWL